MPDAQNDAIFEAGSMIFQVICQGSALAAKKCSISEASRVSKQHWDYGLGNVLKKKHFLNSHCCWSKNRLFRNLQNDEVNIFATKWTAYTFCPSIGSYLKNNPPKTTWTDVDCLRNIPLFEEDFLPFPTKKRTKPFLGWSMFLSTTIQVAQFRELFATLVQQHQEELEVS